MGATITEKILARAAGRSHAAVGEDLLVRPDFVLAYDFPGYTDVVFRQMREDFGIEKVPDPQRYAIFIDHMVPARNPAEEMLHAQTRQWCEENAVTLFERRGIGHQVAVEEGYAVPGAFVVHFDGHVSQLGTYGALAVGIRRNILEAFVKERIAMRVPATVRIDLVGACRPGVMARDVFHYLLQQHGPAMCRFMVMEVGGDTQSLSNDGLQTITGLAMFSGAVTAIVNPDEERMRNAAQRARIRLEPVHSDPDAKYAARYRVDLAAIEPMVVLPPSPANAKALADYLGTEVQVGYLGSCASGRIEDLRAAAEVLRGRTVKPGFSLHVIPTSSAVMSQAIDEGLISIFVAAGAFVSSSTCDFCFGHTGTMMAGQRAVSTGTLNVRGRMGSPDSEILLVNAATLAASSIEGRLADPRKYLG